MNKLATLTAIITIGLTSVAFADNTPPQQSGKHPVEHSDKQPPRDAKAPQHNDGKRDDKAGKPEHKGDKAQHDGKKTQHDNKQPSKDGKKPLPPKEQRN